MTKQDLVRRVSAQLGLSQLETREIVQKTFDGIINTLVKEHRVELRNFGVFQLKWRKPREARNPRTGEKVIVPEKCTVTFKPGQVMQERVRQESRIAAPDGAAHQKGRKAKAGTQ